MSFGPIGTNPYSVEMLTSDEIPWGIDMTEALSTISGGSVSGVTTSLKDLTTGQAVSLADNPSIAGNVVTQIVHGSALVAGHNYQLKVVFTAATNTVLSTLTEIVCLQG